MNDLAYCGLIGVGYLPAHHLVHFILIRSLGLSSPFSYTYIIFFLHHSNSHDGTTTLNFFSPFFCFLFLLPYLCESVHHHVICWSVLGDISRDDDDNTNRPSVWDQWRSQSQISYKARVPERQRARPPSPQTVKTPSTAITGPSRKKGLSYNFHRQLSGHKSDMRKRSSTAQLSLCV